MTVSSNTSYFFFSRDYKFDFTNSDFLAGKIPYIPTPWKMYQKYLFNKDMVTYGHGKMATTLFAKELQRRFDERKLPIISLAIHPGGVKSRGEDSMKLFAWFMRPIVRTILVEADEGSFTSLFAATGKEVRQNEETYKGKYMEPVGKVLNPHPIVDDDTQSRTMWELTLKAVNEHITQKIGAPALPEW